MRKFFIITLVILVFLAGVLSLTPWKIILQGQIISALESRGFSDVNLHVSGLGLKSIILDDITFGTENPLTLKNVKLDYSVAGLRSRRLDKLTISEPAFVFRQIDGRWTVVHFENVRSSAVAKPMSVAVLTETLKKIPFDQVVVERGTMRIETESWTLTLPLETVFDKNLSKISYKAGNAHFRKGALEATIGEIIADIGFDEKVQAWKGQWQADQINVKDAPAPVPPLKGQGTIMGMGAAVIVDGALQSADQSYQMIFRYNHSFDTAAESVLSLGSAVMPWKEGVVKLESVKIPLRQGQPLNLNVQVDGVSVDELLGAMTGQRVTGTGRVSGTIPVTIGKNGDLVFGQGSLTAAGPGKINMPPDAIPGDNEQVALVRNILADLNYTALSISLNNDNQNNLGVTMSVEGSNPAVYNGRAVKLNVNLTGDVLDFIQKNVILLTKPQTLWEDGADE